MDTISAGSILVALVVGMVANRLSQSFCQKCVLRLRTIRLGSEKRVFSFSSMSVSTSRLTAITINVGRFIEKPIIRP